MMHRRFHVKRDDRVMVITGREKGKVGKVLKVLKNDSVIVEKVNLIKRHTRPSPYTGKGGILEKEAPIHVSNVMVLCNKCMNPVRLGKRFLGDGTKSRVCKRCGEVLES
ncbi:MAG TPA: 50S ribosomal protein L24 [Syntrophaceae bacterium]|nr:50S ribosomal protein L24 [Syntrophaceae bacterium]